MMRRRGFTLLEVMVSLVIMLVLGAGMLTFLRDLRVRHQRVSEVSAGQRAAAALIDGLERDLATCTVAAADGPGLRGSATAIEVHSRGVRLSLTAGDTPDDRLVTTYRFDDQRRELSIGRRGENDAASRPETIASDVIPRVRFRYHDGRDWSASFDSARVNALPAAVEVAIWFESSATPETGVDLATDEDDDVAAAFLPDGADAFADEPFAPASASGETWGQPDRLRVIAIPRLTREGGVS